MTSADRLLPSSRNKGTTIEETTNWNNNGEWARQKERLQVAKKKEEEEEKASRKPESGRDYDRVRAGITRITVVGSRLGLPPLSREEGCD